jgi:molybdopterin molybdotransferase
MRTVAEHASALAALVGPTPVVATPLNEALGLVLGRDLIAPVDLPPFDNSAMDGYVGRAADLPADGTFPLTLPVSHDIPAGRSDGRPLAAGTLARIMTGAPLPPGGEVIVPVERTDGGVDRVRIDGVPAPGVHVRRRGEDLTAGTVALAAGTVMGPTQIGLAAALGLATVDVRRPLRVTVLSTGSELMPPGSALEPGQIYESNSPMLAAALRAVGAQVRIEHFVADDVPALLAALEQAATGADLLLTSGGVSAGAYEVVKDALTGPGGADGAPAVDFVKVAMQPGMPQGAGRFAGVPLVTLPGNPVSSYVSFEVFLRPLVRAAMGHPDVMRPVLRVPLADAISSPAGKRQFRRGHLDTEAGTVSAWGGPGSHLLSWLAGADSMIVVDEDATSLQPGDEVEVWLLD